ncbi:MAG: hypothetical protein HQL28_03860, partial [Candidatus Omnitrophica bacterium]|nr:hypothetical protein [Candidatus Omnitrophota bacterium]
MDIKNVFLKDLGINRLTGSSLRKAISHTYDPWPDNEKKRINREIAHFVIQAATAKRMIKHQTAGTTASLPHTKVLGVNYAGLLDITLEWKTRTDGTLGLSGARVDSGGDQINVSKVFDHFNENIALVALAGKEGEEITAEWERNFISERIIPALIRSDEEDAPAALYNII